MRKNLRAAIVAGLSLSCMYAASPTPQVTTQVLNQCDLNGDGVVNLLDVQVAVNMTVGLTPCTTSVVSVGTCNITLVQRITNAAVTGFCITGPIVHSVSLSWTASTSTNVAGYNIYRGTQTGGPYTKINAFPVPAVTYTDLWAQAGATYYYVTTSLDVNNNESVYSNEAQAVIPVP